MEWEKDLRRSQSLRSLSSQSDKAIWTDTGLQDRAISVSQLVARYQTTVAKGTTSQAAPDNNVEGKKKAGLKEQIPPSPLKSRETHPDSLLKKNDEREQARTKVSLTRSKSVGSLQTGNRSIEALKAVFETKATAEYKPKSSFRAGNPALDHNTNIPLVNGEAEEVQIPWKEQMKPAKMKSKKEQKDDSPPQKVVNQTKTEKRKSVAGIDFERLAASEAACPSDVSADEKRKSAADSRDNSFVQTKEVLSVSVKALSALYMSKVANREVTISPKVVKDQAQPRNSGKVVKPTKMNEDYQQRKDDFTHQPAEEHKTGLEEISEAHSEQLTSLQLSPEMLFQQRQKTELRRLLKHTCPELKRLDDAVDEEFAEVLSSEMKLGGKTGYEGEVLSRCMIFESRNLSSNNNPKIYVAEEGLESKQYRKTASDFERLKEEPKTKEFEVMLKSNKSPNLTSDFNKDVEEEIVKKDAQVSRKVVENQSSSTHKQNEIQGNAPLDFKKEIITGKIMEQSEAYSAIMPHGENKSMEKDSEEKAPCVNRICQSATNDSSCSIAFSGNDLSLEEFSKGLPDSEIKNKTTTNSDLFQNNPFISANIEQQNSYCHASKTHIQSSLAEEGYPIANVKNRAHLFESMPFDKIRHQNQDEIEMLVENIKETLDFLHHVKAIHSDGAIIEVNETMIAKKSKFTISDQGPELKYNEFAEGGARNFIVQLLPRVNLKHQIIYLKEDSKGLMKTTVLDALAHQHHFSVNKDTELKTANVIQLVEDILNQDNSLRKGVIIQEDDSKYGEVIVYSLYKYFDEKDVKSYIPPKGAEHEEPETHTELLSKSDPDPSFSGSVRPNVKLLKSYIEKGDLEYLRSLHDDEPTVHRSGLSQNQAALKQDDKCQHEQQSDSAEECIQVDVKTLKNMFSEGKSPIHSKTSAVSSGKSQSPVECNTEVFLLPQHTHRINTCFVQDPKKIVAYSDSQNDNRVHELEMAEVVNVNDKVSDPKTAFYSHDQAENKSCFQEIYTEGLSEIPIANAIADTDRRSKTDSEAYQSKESTVLNQSETNLTAMVYPQFSEETSLQEEDKTCYKGTIQAALNSLERSNINITRGDFKAAMIYRHSYVSNKKTSPKDVQKNNTTDLCPMCKLSQEQPKQELTWENKNPHQTKEPLNLEETVTNADPPYQPGEPLNLEVRFVNAEPPNLTEELLNREVTVTNVEPPHPNIKSPNLVEPMPNAESPQPTEDTLNLEVIVADKEPLHQTEELLNLGMAVANAKLPKPAEETLNLEVVTGNVKPPHTAEGRLNLEVNVENVAPSNPTEGPVKIEGTLENAESPHPNEETPTLQVIVVNEEPPNQIEDSLNQGVAMTYAKLSRPTEETLNKEVTVANMEPCNPSKQQESSLDVESPNPIQVSVNIEATVENVKPPHPTEKPLNLELTEENANPSDQNKSSQNLEGTLTNVEPRFTSEKLLNLEVAVANAEPSHPFENPQNPHVAVANAVLPQQSKEPLNSGKTILNSVENNCTATQGAVLKRSKRVIGPKPPIPPKPEHLKANHAINQPSPTRLPEEHKISNVGTKETAFQVPQPSITTPILNQEGSISQPVDNHENQNLGEGTKMLHETQGKSEVQSLTSVSENNGNIIKNINEQHKTSNIGKEEVPQTTSANNICDTDETHINFHEARQKFGGKGLPLKKIAPVKPKRVKPIQSSDKSHKHLPGESTRDGIVQMRADPLSNAFEIPADRVDSIDKDTEQKNKVEMREKKATIETEDENRQRLSIHMDEIVRGNVTAAMEIFEHLRKQEQLESILSRVKEIESDTSKVDVRSLRRVFENIPDWVVNTDKKRQTKVPIETKDKSMQLPADIKNKSSMEYIYGDLERASEEIIHLKEQTLARLKDIEDTIKKALFSVSTLKSDSDIASLSNLFKESLGVAEGSSFSSNINKSGLSKTKPQEPQESSLPESSTSTGAAPSPTTDTFTTMQGQSPPSSPEFVSIHSIARKTDNTETAPQDMSICVKCQMNLRPEGKFRTMKTVSCNSPTSGKKDPSNGGQKQMSKCQQNREVSVLQVKTDSGGSVTGATVEKYERTDYSGNQLYTSTVSAVIATQPKQ